MREQRPRGNLPARLTSFIGREHEQIEVARLLGTTRLLTLTGSPGVGKTRLGLHVAADVLPRYPDGVWLVELAPLVDPAVVPQTVALVFGLHERRGRPLTATLAEYLRSRSLLLVLDNCEHLIDACATLADGLLRACPELRVLATSRELLGVAGEVALRLPSLALPDLRHLPPTEELVQYAAVRLFIERAEAALGTLSLPDQQASAVAQICHRLDGIPLAIELAAARVNVLSVEQIAARLDDRFRLLTGGNRTALPRQQTLRAAIDWSFDLLSEPERVLLRRLSVFAGGWTLEAAEAIESEQSVRVRPEASGSQSPASSPEVLELLARLVEKSLVLVDGQAGAARYRLLQTVRQYAEDRLLAADEAAAVRDLHRDWCVALVERARPKLEGPEQAVWFERLEAEHDNLRAALAWSQTDPNDLEAGLRLAAPLWWFWMLRGHLREGREWLTALLAQSPTPTVARAQALWGAGYLAFAQGDYDQARGLVEESLALSRALGDQRGIAAALAQLGRDAHARGDFAAATRRLEESLALFQELGIESGLPYPVASILADVARDQGDDQRARTLYEQGLASAQGRGDNHAAAYPLRGLAHLLRARDDFTQAERLFKESLALIWDLRDQRCACLSIEGLARATVGRGSAQRAAELFGLAETLRELVGTQLLPTERAGYEQDLAAVRAALGPATFDSAWAEGQGMAMEQAVQYALDSVPRPPRETRASRHASASEPASPLSARELQVATLIAQGLTNREIATELVIAERTVDAHVHNILGKLELRSRAQVAAWAVQQGFP